MQPVEDEAIRQAFVLANKLAKDRNLRWLGIDHLVGGLLTFMPDIKLPFMLQDYYNALVTYVEPEHQPDPLPLTPRVKKVVAAAEKIARRAKAKTTTCEMLLLASLDEREGMAYQLLDELKFPFDDIREQLRDRIAKGETSSVTQFKIEAINDPVSLSIDQVPGKTIKKIVTRTISEKSSQYEVNGVGGGHSEYKVIELHFTDGTTFEYGR